LENGIPSHDTIGRLFGLLDKEALEKSFRRWVGGVLPALAKGTVVAIDGKASRRSRLTGKQALHMVSAFAAAAGPVLGQEGKACAEKSNELTAIPVLLEALMLKDTIVTIDAMGTHSNIAQSIRDKKADYVLLVKGNQPTLAESIATFFEFGQSAQWRAAKHAYVESVEKDHGRLEVRCCWAFDRLECLANPQHCPDLKMFGVIEAERTINGTTTYERRLYIGSIAADAATLANAVRSHWGIENRVHWCLDLALNDDQMRARVKKPAQTSPSSAVSSSISLASTRLEKPDSTPDASLPRPPTPTAKPSWDCRRFDAIALQPPGTDRLRQGIALDPQFCRNHRDGLSAIEQGLRPLQHLCRQDRRAAAPRRNIEPLRPFLTIPLQRALDAQRGYPERARHVHQALVTLRDPLHRDHPEGRQILLRMTEHRQEAVEIHHSPALLPDRQQALDRRRARKTRLSAFSGIFAISARVFCRNPRQCLIPALTR